MSVQTQITRIANAVDAAKVSIANKGVAVPEEAKIDALPGLIDQIESGQQITATINVTTTAGATVTCSWDGETLTATATDGTCSFTVTRNGAWEVTATVDDASVTETVIIYEDGQTESVVIMVKATASTSATSGVSYTAGLSGLSADEVSMFAKAISDNSAITSATSTVYVDYVSIHRELSVGDQVTLTLNSTIYAFDVLGFNHDPLAEATAYGEATATGKAGISLQMHDLFFETYPMNTSQTNSGGWTSCKMRTSTMATMKGYLPSAWQTILKPVSKRTSEGNKSATIETTTDSCFLLSEVEISGSTIYSASGEGSQYAYYKAGNSKIKNEFGSAGDWWARSPNDNSAGTFCIVSSGGSVGSRYATGSYGVAFGFCV